jgi:hypothetical protein
MQLSLVENIELPGGPEIVAFCATIFVSEAFCREPFRLSRTPAFRNFKNRVPSAKRFPFFGIPESNPEK